MRHKKHPLTEKELEHIKSVGNSVAIGTDAFVHKGELTGNRPTLDDGQTPDDSAEHIQLRVWIGNPTIVQPALVSGKDYGDPYKYNGEYDKDFNNEDLRVDYRNENLPADDDDDDAPDVSQDSPAPEPAS